MATQTTTIRTDIRAANDRFESTFGRGDSTGMAALYTDNGMLLPTGSEFIAGKPSIAQFWQGAMDMGIANAKLETVELEQHGDTAIEVGKYTLSSADGQVMDRGKYVVIWKHTDGGWKLHRDIWNSSQPA